MVAGQFLAENWILNIDCIYCRNHWRCSMLCLLLLSGGEHTLARIAWPFGGKLPTHRWQLPGGGCSPYQAWSSEYTEPSGKALDSLESLASNLPDSLSKDPL
jgi:hypothetical protein